MKHPILPGNTIKNNDPATTYYRLSIEELVELIDDYHYNYDEIDSKSSYVELMVDYIVKNHK